MIQMKSAGATKTHKTKIIQLIVLIKGVLSTLVDGASKNSLAESKNSMKPSKKITITI